MITHQHKHRAKSILLAHNKSEAGEETTYSTTDRTPFFSPEAALWSMRPGQS